MSEIIKEIMKDLPAEKISDAGFEGANIVFYTKDKDFLFNNNGIIKMLVDKFKKRIELRPDPSVVMEPEKAKEEIMQIIPKESGADNIIFDTQRSQVIIEAEKPGLAIGKQGMLLREIRQKTLWVPLIRRKPALRSQIIENIRAVLYQHSEWRRKFLNKVGHRVYDGWIRGKKEEWIRVTYLGSGRQVGRSCIFLQTPESRILMDCGIDVAASGEDAYPYLDAPELKIPELDALIVSHSHLDHAGLVPYLFKFGFDGPIYCTEPTRDVMALMQLDFVKIMKNEGKEPLYTSEEIKEMVKHCVCLDYEEVTDITPDVRLTFYNAGHILGSSMCHLHVANGLHNLLYSADMKFGRSPLLDPASYQFPRLETLMLEATYGGKENFMPAEKELDDMFAGIVKDTVQRNGKILMPVLGSGRAQDMMIVVERLHREGQLEKVPIFIDGLVWDITAIHTAYPEYLNALIRKQIFHHDQNPFLSDIFKRVGSPKERQQILEETGSCIIMATSGMLVGGPSVEYLKALADNPKNSLIFSCYQGEGSLGRKIQNGDREIILGYDPSGKPEVLKLNMEIHRIQISDHSDRRQLMSFVHKCEPRPKKVIINHGESMRCLDLASSIHKQNRIETTCPRNLEAVRLR
ncbi:beta-CASP ribonuclease aCPSF1 [Candidatus Woesearchaeota archaeon]|nr:beta-CASP ribonuclease aCPSF1 [Candidatus Woesearchaeota archaeon]